VSAANGTIHHNHVHHNRAVGIYVDGGFYTQYGGPGTPTTNIAVYNNLVHDGGTGGIALATEGVGDLRNVDVYNNVVYGNTGQGLTLLDYEGEISNLRYFNNTIFQNGGNGIFFTHPQATGCEIFNNIFSQNGGQIVVSYGGKTGNVAVANNLIDGYSSYNGDNSVTGDPLFVDPDQQEFHIQAGSPAIDAAQASSAPELDYDDFLRPNNGLYDIGAYEFGSEPVPLSSKLVSPRNHSVRAVLRSRLGDGYESYNYAGNRYYDITGRKFNFLPKTGTRAGIRIELILKERLW